MTRTLLTIAIMIGLSTEASGMPEGVCRVFADTRGGRSIGSGTLVGNTPDGAEGLVLTCAHVVGEQGASILVEFPGRGRHQARVVAVDVGADLAALSIGNPRASALEISPQTIPAGAVMACGYGAGGEARCVRGDVIGLAEAEGQTSLRIQGAVRPGDSGGCVLDSSGAFVAVVWGQAEGVTYASTGGPLRRFLSRLLGGRRPAVVTCPGGSCPVCPTQPRTPPTVWPGRPILDGLLSTELRKRLEAIEQRQGELVTREELANLLGEGDSPRQGSTPEGALLDEPSYVWSVIGELRRVAGPLVAMASPAAGAVLLSGGGVGALWLVLRLLARRRRRKSETVGDVPEEATADAGTTFQKEASPIERDDAEARELLRLSQLEGRDPLQDALAGRLAIDRLDAIAESDVDKDRAAWADQLRRELRERFNEVAPTKFGVAV